MPDAVPLKTAGHFLRLSGKHHKTPIVQLRLSSRWCGWRDSNSHTSRHWHLKPACLPVPPHPLSQEGESTKVRNCIRNCARKTSHTRYPRNGAAGEPDPRIHESGLLTPGSSSDAPQTRITALGTNNLPFVSLLFLSPRPPRPQKNAPHLDSSTRPEACERSFNGVDGGARTLDHRNHNPGLYQLSYVHHSTLGAPQSKTQRVPHNGYPADYTEVRNRVNS